MGDKRQMRLGLSLVSNGTHTAGWRYPGAHADAGMDFKVWKDMSTAAERAKIHFIFLADGAAVRTTAKDDDALSYSGRIDQFEPLTLISALSAVTERIGFVSTASTTYNEPYTIARKFASIDHISGGRVGWNVVTGWSEAEAKNFNRDAHMEHEERYERAEEFVDVVFGLWDSWDDDAFSRDKSSGQYFDPQKMHVLNHKGKHFAVKGPINMTRPPQGYPVIAQAGSSPPGQALAARTADLVYTAAQELAPAKRFYDEIKEKVARAGRSPDQVLVMPGVLPVIASTDAEAQRKYQEIQDLIHPKTGLNMLARTFGDLSSYPLDGPVPEVPINMRGTQSIAQAHIEMARRENLTIRQLYQRVSGAAGHRQIVGSPERILDQMLEWWDAGAADGFNIMAPYHPGGLTDFLDHVVPLLRKRGLFRSEYEGVTLRDNLGLTHVPDRRRRQDLTVRSA